VSIFDQEEPEAVTLGGRSYSLDRHGFLDPPEQWDETFARGMADELGIHTGLTEEHWGLIHYLRERFLDERTIPLVVFACIDNGLKLSRLRYLFPTGYHRGACRVAGLSFAFLSDDNFWHTMETYRPPLGDYELTDLGFLERFDSWDERFAWLAGREAGLEGPLAEAHKRVLLFLRERFAERGTIPTVFETCRTHGLGLDDLRALFPGGYRRGACRMAGLPMLP